MGVPLRILSYNVHSLRDDLSALAAVVRGLEPDVMIVQEAPRRWRWRTRCADLAYSFRLVVAEGGLPSVGNLILTNLRVQVVESWCLRYPLTPGRHLRGAAFARLRVPGAEPFVVAGSHLSTDDTERPAQAALLRPAVTAAGERVIIGMDLNDVPGSMAWDLFADGLADLGAGGPATFPASGPTRRIDGIFTSPSLRVHSYQVFDGPPVQQASDHLPLVADLLV